MFHRSSGIRMNKSFRRTDDSQDVTVKHESTLLHFLYVSDAAQKQLLVFPVTLLPRVLVVLTLRCNVCVCVFSGMQHIFKCLAASVKSHSHFLQHQRSHRFTFVKTDKTQVVDPNCKFPSHCFKIQKDLINATLIR